MKLSRGKIVSPALDFPEKESQGKLRRRTEALLWPLSRDYLDCECGDSMCDCICNIKSGEDERALERKVGRGRDRCVEKSCGIPLGLVFFTTCPLSG